MGVDPRGGPIRHSQEASNGGGWCARVARRSISEWVDIWRIEGLLTQKLYRNGCIERDLVLFLWIGLLSSSDSVWTLA